MNGRSASTVLAVDAVLLGQGGYLVVTHVGRYTVTAEGSAGKSFEIPYGELAAVSVADGKAEAVMASVEPWWSSLPAHVQAAALMLLEVVQEIITG